jgi:hypothetical protein
MRARVVNLGGKATRGFDATDGVRVGTLRRHRRYRRRCRCDTMSPREMMLMMLLMMTTMDDEDAVRF